MKGLQRPAVHHPPHATALQHQSQLEAIPPSARLAARGHTLAHQAQHSSQIMGDMLHLLLAVIGRMGDGLTPWMETADGLVITAMVIVWHGGMGRLLAGCFARWLEFRVAVLWCGVHCVAMVVSGAGCRLIPSICWRAVREYSCPLHPSAGELHACHCLCQRYSNTIVLMVGLGWPSCICSVYTSCATKAALPN